MFVSVATRPRRLVLSYTEQRNKYHMFKLHFFKINFEILFPYTPEFYESSLSVFFFRLIVSSVLASCPAHSSLIW